jgi:hypothetical protein
MANNLADISTFESIQLNQHNRTNMGSMSVFNESQEVQTMKTVFDLYTPKVDDAVKKYREYESVKKEYERASSEWNQAADILDDAQKVYDEAICEIQKSLKKRAEAALDAKSKDGGKLLNEYKQDYAAIWDMQHKVIQKEILS